MTTISYKKQTHLYEIDFMRALCCVLVVLIHVSAAYIASNNPTKTYTVIFVMNTLSKFVVPCFLFISGFTLFYVNRDRTLSIKNFYTHRLIKIVTPYVLWSSLYFIIKYKGVLLNFGVLEWISKILMGLSSYHLYYMFLILQFYILFPILMGIFKKINHPWISFILFLGLTICGIYFTTFPYRDRNFVYYLIFFTAGFSFGEIRLNGKEVHKVLQLIIIILTIAAGVYFVVEHYNYTLGKGLFNRHLYLQILRIYGLLSSISLLFASTFLLNKWRKLIDNPVVTSLSNLSFTIYLSHPLVLMIYRRFTNPIQFAFPAAFKFILDFIIVFSITWLLSKAIVLGKKYLELYFRNLKIPN